MEIGPLMRIWNTSKENQKGVAAGNTHSETGSAENLSAKAAEAEGKSGISMDLT